MDSAPVTSNIEQLDDRIRKAREIVQGSYNALARDRAGLIQRYIEGDLNLAVICTNAGPRHYGIVLEAVPHAVKSQSRLNRIGGNHDSAGHRSNLDKSSVLPGYVEIVESDETGIIPSVPRLEIFDERLIGLGKPLYRFTSRVFPYEEVILRSANREMSVFWVRVTGAFCESIDKDVETASKTINDRSDFCIDDWGRLNRIRQVNAFLADLRMRLFPETVRGFLAPGYQSPFERIELGYGPINGSLGV